MSLINKMLKDLDKRSGDAQLSEAARASVRSVNLGKTKKGRPFLWLSLLVLVAVSAFAAWSYRDKFFKPSPTPAQPKAIPLVASAPTPAVTNPPAPVPSALAQAQMPLQDKTPAANPAPRVATVVANTSNAAPRPAAAVPKASTTPTLAAAPIAKSVAVKPTTVSKQASVTTARASTSTAATPAVSTSTKSATKPSAFGVQNAKNSTDKSLWKPAGQAAASSQPKPAVKVMAAKPGAAKQTKKLSSATTAANSKKMQVEVTPQQEADNEYGKAVRLLEEGRRAEAMATLENVLMKQYKHVAARQMLAGLLVAEKRPYEAMNVLKAGLRLDSSQTEMAMLLARLAIEQGDNRSALATLQQSLNYARAKPDYQAFLAAVYQRENRHKEAIEHYRAALGEMPGNGVWWMGYGMSLQAIGRGADAKTAFTQARDSGSLSPQLKEFVEQRLVQLSQ